MCKSLEELVYAVLNFPGLKTEPGDVFLDIAANDGQMLTSPLIKERGLQAVGIDPSDVAANSPLYEHPVSSRQGIRLINDFFSEKVYWKHQAQRAKVVTIVAMFYDLDDPVGFLRQVRNCMDVNGVLCIQLSYTPLMLQQRAFDNIGHEHLCYYTLNTLRQVLEAAGFRLVDCELNTVNAGSIRVMAVDANNPRTMVPMHTKLVEKARLDSVLAFEDNESVGDLSAWKCFAEDVEDQKQATIRLLSQLKADGKVVVGYGASTKGNTILQTYGLTPDLLPAIAERSEPKFGLFTVGTGIPIISEQQMRQMRPHFLFIFPYTFIDVFMEREKDLLAQGTKLIAPLPALNIYG
jgi:hypothetical protein